MGRRLQPAGLYQQCLLYICCNLDVWCGDRSVIGSYSHLPQGLLTAMPSALRHGILELVMVEDLVELHHFYYLLDHNLLEFTMTDDVTRFLEDSIEVVMDLVKFRCRRLRVLTLASLSVPTPVMNTLCMSLPASLQVLNLSHAHITNHVLHNIAHNLHSLHTLDVSYCDVTDEGLRALIPRDPSPPHTHRVAVGCPYLRSLSLYGLDDVTVQCLVDLWCGLVHLCKLTHSSVLHALVSMHCSRVDAAAHSAGRCLHELRVERFFCWGSLDYRDRSSFFCDVPAPLYQSLKVLDLYVSESAGKELGRDLLLLRSLEELTLHRLRSPTATLARFFSQHGGKLMTLSLLCLQDVPDMSTVVTHCTNVRALSLEFPSSVEQRQRESNHYGCEREPLRHVTGSLQKLRLCNVRQKDCEAVWVKCLLASPALQTVDCHRCSVITDSLILALYSTEVSPFGSLSSLTLGRCSYVSIHAVIKLLDDDSTDLHEVRLICCRLIQMGDANIANSTIAVKHLDVQCDIVPAIAMA